MLPFVVLPSKLTNILAAGGHAIVTAEESTELGRLAQRHPGIYSLIEPENPEALAHKIIQLINAGTTTHNSTARKYAEENLDRNVIIKRFTAEISSRFA